MIQTLIIEAYCVVRQRLLPTDKRTREHLGSAELILVTLTQTPDFLNYDPMT